MVFSLATAPSHRVEPTGHKCKVGKTMKFKMEVSLGNEAMKTAEQVAMALEATAKRLRMYSVDKKVQLSIRDGNGNRVGSWELSEK